MTTRLPLLVTLALLVPTPSGLAEPVDQILTLQGISFHVKCANEGSLNRLTIKPGGLELDNETIEQEVNGTVSGVEVADLNADGSPEIYVYVTSAGSGSYGSLVAYSANRKKSLSEIYFFDLKPESKEARGYRGHDEFAVVENVLARRFPLYREDDSNAKPNGGTRQLQYKLKAGEAGWILELDKMVDY